MESFRAYGNDGAVCGDTPRQAALAFFAKFPSKRKCDIIQGQLNDGVFSIRLSFIAGQQAKRYKDITKKTAETLPDHI